MTDTEKYAEGDTVIIRRGKLHGQQGTVLTVHGDTLGLRLDSGEPVVQLSSNVRRPADPTISLSALTDAVAAVSEKYDDAGPTLTSLIEGLNLGSDATNRLKGAIQWPSSVLTAEDDSSKWPVTD